MACLALRTAAGLSEEVLFLMTRFVVVIKGKGIKGIHCCSHSDGL
jgi:hypothetical protein